ncbi:MAG TPA: multidrug efflux RND transporter permease subunit [Gemmatimonadaceae bacterium]|nr:multidrug efflux RND transporter permease subunit [Gemmatimonadaceae bacterium]
MSDPHPPGTPHEIRYLFIRRPILAAVISIVIVLVGAFALLHLPVNRYPSITPPVVQVSAVYPGASAEEVAQTVAAPIEQQLSGIPGLLYFKSTSSSDGSMSLQVYFDISRNQDLAAVDVQNQVNLAAPQLPDEVRRQGIVVRKAQTDILLAVVLTSDDPRYDAEYLSNYSHIYVEDELKRVPGVGDASTFGQLQFAMRLSLDPDRMAQLGVTMSDVVNAVNEQNATNPAGLIGQEPAPDGTQLTLPVNTQGRLTTPEEFANIIVRARPDGSVLRVRDIGRVVLGAQNYNLQARVDGKAIGGILVYLRPGANALQVRNAVLARLKELSRSFPSGVHYIIPFDTTPFITTSIHEVVVTLLIALALVTVVVFVFLQNWRSTLIPLLAVPVSIIGTFFGMLLLGFTTNLLTLFGLVLAIGIVVDDAIVVIENVERIMADQHVPPAVAADLAIRQVRGALIAIVLALCAVFIPVAFIGGITGQMYKQFAITIVVSVVLSGIVALTLTPALCALLLRHEDKMPERGFFAWFNRTFERSRAGYVRTVGRTLERPRVMLACFAVTIALAFVLFRTIPTGFIPSEDKGYFAVSVELPGGASLQRTEEVVHRVESFIKQQPAVQHVFALVGFSLIQGASQTSSATMFVNLKPWDERTSKSEQIGAVLGKVNGMLFQMRDATAFAFNLPEIPGLGTTAGLEMNLQDRGINDVRRFAAVAQQFAAEANKQPALQQVSTTIRVNVPQIHVDVDRAKAKALGVSLSSLFQTLQAMLSSLYINDFNLYGKTYRVLAEAQPQFRTRPEDIGRLYVRGGDQQMIPVSALTTTEFRGGPSIINRFNGFTSALVNGSPAPGRSSGQMLDAAEGLADRYASRGVGYALSGQSFQERASGGQSAIVLTFGIVMVFLVLAALYESWSIPFAVLLGVPFGILGALLGLLLRGIPNDIYFQIGLVAVIGLAAKNAILIVEFATELRAQGRTIGEAAIEAGRERLRPILMTSFAFILGVAPLLVASGAGAASRHSIGTGVFFGMLVATLIGIFFIPFFFAEIRAWSERGILHRRSRAEGVAPPSPPQPRPTEGDD